MKSKTKTQAISAISVIYVMLFVFILGCASDETSPGDGGNQTLPMDVSAIENGLFDTTFGSSASGRREGFVTANFASGGARYDGASGVALDLQGRIVVAGTTQSAAGDLDLMVLRYTSDGELDPLFGTQRPGFFYHHSAAGGSNDEGAAVAIDQQRRIVVVGSSDSPGSNRDMTVWRLTENGQLDTSFGARNPAGGRLGYVVHAGAAGGSGADHAAAVAIDPLGRIIVAGYSTNTRNNNDIAIWRFTQSGDLDLSFGDALPNGQRLGHFTLSSPAGGDGADRATAIVIDLTGRILVAGYTTNAAGNQDAVILRLNNQGLLDPQFGTQNGPVTRMGYIVRNSIAGGNQLDLATCVLLDSQQRPVLIGHSSAGQNRTRLFVSRYDDQGEADLSFGDSFTGRFRTGTAIVSTTALAGLDSATTGFIDSQDRVVVAGYRTPDLTTRIENMSLARLTFSGNIDTTFGDDAGNGQRRGYYSYARPSPGFGRFLAMRRDIQERAVLVGTGIGPTGTSDAFVWRLLLR
ncbi:MAG: delta-60 repeat domain-containing protein [Bdellovibrionota bacterium]